MIGYVGLHIERWDEYKKNDVLSWLVRNYDYGWYIEDDLDFQTLYMTDDIYLRFILTWS